MHHVLLTDIEVAELLGTRRRVVQSWRLGGHLAHMRSRPVLMTDQAVFDFIEACNNNASIPKLVIASRDDVKQKRWWSRWSSEPAITWTGSTPKQRVYVPERETSLRKGILISDREAAEWLRCSERLIVILRKAGFLPCCPGLDSLIITGAVLRMLQPYEGTEYPNAELLRIYDRDTAAVRLGIAPKEVSLLHGLGRMGYIPVRPILYREADILNYLAAQENYERNRAEKRKLSEERAAAKAVRVKDRKTGAPGD